jgi:hypothetical protein
VAVADDRLPDGRTDGETEVQRHREVAHGLAGAFPRGEIGDAGGGSDVERRLPRPLQAAEHEQRGDVAGQGQQGEGHGRHARSRHQKQLPPPLVAQAAGQGPGQHRGHAEGPHHQADFHSPAAELVLHEAGQGDDDHAHGQEHRQRGGDHEREGARDHALAGLRSPAIHQNSFLQCRHAKL